MKNNLLKIILILIIIILTLTIILFVKIGNQKKKITVQEIINSLDDTDYLRSDVLIPENSYKFFEKYTYGQLSSKEILEEIDSFAKNILIKYVREVSSLSSEQLYNYYLEDENKKINDDLIYAENYKEFYDFIEKAQKVKNKDSVYIKEIKFDVASIVEQNDYTCGLIIFKLSDNTEFTFKYKILKDKTDRSIMFYCNEK